MSSRPAPSRPADNRPPKRESKPPETGPNKPTPKKYVTVRLSDNPVADVAGWPAPTPEQTAELRRLLPPVRRVKEAA